MATKLQTYLRLSTSAFSFIPRIKPDDRPIIVHRSYFEKRGYLLLSDEKYVSRRIVPVIDLDIERKSTAISEGISVQMQSVMAKEPDRMPIGMGEKPKPPPRRVVNAYDAPVGKHDWATGLVMLISMPLLVVVAIVWMITHHHC